MKAKISIIVIGRNEGQRLVNCFDSLQGYEANTIYVDSGSTDGSQDAAIERGITVLELDTTQPFTAARARNFGANYAMDSNAELEYIAFFDGDCIVDDQWLEKSAAFLDINKGAAVACGRRREIYPQATKYNLLCDIEWNTPIGETSACGGDSVMRASAFKSVGGFRDSHIAGEEPELCYRLRQEGWLIYRIDESMTLHDANITQFKQWYLRAKRCGYSFALNAHMYGREKEHLCVKESLRIWLWGAMYPAIMIFLSLTISTAFLLGLMVYPVQVIRIAMFVKAKSPAYTPKEAFIYSVFIVLGRVPEMSGQLKYLSNIIKSKQHSIIEYK